MSRVMILGSHPFLGWKNGADLAALQLARQLGARGHDCVLALTLMDVAPALERWRTTLAPRTDGATGDRFALDGVPVSLSRIAVPTGLHPRALRDACAAAIDQHVAAQLRELKPDVVLVPWGTLALARVARAHHERVLLWVQNGEAVEGMSADAYRGLSIATVSPDLARRIRKRIGREPLVILNPIERDGVVAEDGPRDHIGMVNFCAEKGAIVLLNVAANLPDRRFIGTGGWAGRALDYTAMNTGLGNLTIAPPFDRMSELYRQLRMLLIPSLCQEAFGRVVIEAQLSGVPVVVSSRCGARDWAGRFVVPVKPRPRDIPGERYYQDAELHRDTIKGFLDAIVTLENSDNHAIAVAEGHALAARYFNDQTASIERFERWLAG